MPEDQPYQAGFLAGLIKAFGLWTAWRPGRIAALLARLWHFWLSARRRARWQRREGLQVPPILILSVTTRCNLTCAGCYSREYDQERELTLEEMDSLFRQAKALGVTWVVLTGGEPLQCEGLLDLVSGHPQLLFFLFNNGTYLDAPAARRLGRMRHVVPILSVEGDERLTDARRGPGAYARVMEAMAHLRRAGAFFGFSCMATRANLPLLSADAFIDEMIRQGCRFGYFVGFVPSAQDSDQAQVPPAEEQAAFRRRVKAYQGGKRIILVQMPEDEYEIAGSCMAAGRGFVHVNALGQVEPCPFSHWAKDSLRTGSLRQALASPWLARIRERAEWLGPTLQGCALFEHRAELEPLARREGAVPTERRRA
ncbi:MAG: radical SAM protein [candidate division FCPU426 bacterium]